MQAQAAYDAAEKHLESVRSVSQAQLPRLNFRFCAAGLLGLRRLYRPPLRFRLGGVAGYAHAPDSVAVTLAIIVLIPPSRP